MVEPSKPGYYASHPKKYGEYILLQVAKDFDTKKATKAKNKLVKDNEAFLTFFIGDWLEPETQYLFPELLQEARLAFLLAIDRYNLSRDVSIRTVAKYYLLKMRESFFKKSPYTELKEIHLQEECFLPDPDVIYSDLRVTLTEAVTHLTATEQSVIQLHFFEGLKNRSIAAVRRISEARVSAVRTSALQKLKIYLVGRGIEPGLFNFN
jgi:RNA polymerase sigma factor (sigma-70 family)